MTNWTGPDPLSPDQRRDILRKEVERQKDIRHIYQAALWEIYKLCGEDTDGDEGPGALIAGNEPAGFADIVVQAVRQLREEYDESLAWDERTAFTP